MGDKGLCGVLMAESLVLLSQHLSLNREHRTEKCAGDDETHPGYRVKLKAREDANRR